MFTKYQDIHSKKIYTVITQQYEVGTYFIVNGNSELQGFSELTEEEFHKKLRKDILKRGDILLAGNLILLHRKSKYNINDFKEK